jgi:hypothetical protein
MVYLRSRANQLVVYMTAETAIIMCQSGVALLQEKIQRRCEEEKADSNFLSLRSSSHHVVNNHQQTKTTKLMIHIITSVNARRLSPKKQVLVALHRAFNTPSLADQRVVIVVRVNEQILPLRLVVRGTEGLLRKATNGCHDSTWI